jgi:hypothetical protein
LTQLPMSLLPLVCDTMKLFKAFGMCSILVMWTEI